LRITLEDADEKREEQWFKKSRKKVRVFKRERSWAETQETSLRSDEQCENWINRIDHRKDETSFRCELRFEQRVMRWKREVDKKLRRKRQRRLREMLKVERKRAIIYELRKRRWAVSTRFSQFEKASNSNVQTSADKLQLQLQLQFSFIVLIFL